MSQNQIPNAVFKGAFGIIEKLQPLKQKKDPAVAAVCGFALGGLGLGLYLQSWTDFFLPILIWLVIMVLGLPTGELLLITAPAFCAMYGYHRAKSSNAELDARQSAAPALRS